jgi:lauroyl/myristoyl acyltransferase
VAEAVQRLAGEIEWAIRRAPHQWFCLRRLW